MRARHRARRIGGRAIGLACVELGAWLLVTAASACTNLAQVITVAIGVLAVSAGIGPLVAPAGPRRAGPGGSRPPRRRARPGLVLVGPPDERATSRVVAAAQDAVLELSAAS